VEARVAPTAAENLPASHSAQAVLTPASVLYLPASQLSHAAALIPAVYLPAGHGCLSLEAPGQKYPAGHGTPAVDKDPAEQ
jgi:hypothetical protein